MKYLMITLLSLLIVISLSGCLGLTSQDIRDGYSILKELTTSKDSTDYKQPVDSMKISFPSVYWKEPKQDSTGKEQEKEFVKNGYLIWRLRTPETTRYEVRKLDSVIYFYKKK